MKNSGPSLRLFEAAIREQGQWPLGHPCLLPKKTAPRLLPKKTAPRLKGYSRLFLQALNHTEIQHGHRGGECNTMDSMGRY
jgi:hypothetical protein